jgi:hypothetical protein
MMIGRLRGTLPSSRFWLQAAGLFLALPFLTGCSREPFSYVPVTSKIT